MSSDDKLAKIMSRYFNNNSACLECRVYKKSKNKIKLAAIGTEKQEIPLKFTKNVKILDHIDIAVGNRVLVAFIDGNSEKPVIVGKIK